MRVVLDTSVVIAALRSDNGSAAEILRLVLDGEITILMDYKLAYEYEAVALRPQHLHISGLSKFETRVILQYLCDIAEPVEVTQSYRPLSPDADDDMVLELAINAQAEAVVSFNVRHLTAPLRPFGIEVYRPAEFLKLWRK